MVEYLVVWHGSYGRKSALCINGTFGPEIEGFRFASWREADDFAAIFGGTAWPA